MRHVISRDNKNCYPSEASQQAKPLFSRRSSRPAIFPRCCVLVRSSASITKPSGWTGELKQRYLRALEVSGCVSFYAYSRSDVTVVVLGREEVGKNTFISHSLVSLVLLV